MIIDFNCNRFQFISFELHHLSGRLTIGSTPWPSSYIYILHIYISVYFYLISSFPILIRSPFLAYCYSISSLMPHRAISAYSSSLYFYSQDLAPSYALLDLPKPLLFLPPLIFQTSSRYPINRPSVPTALSKPRKSWQNIKTVQQSNNLF